jgi:hypothetical protein
MTQKTMSPRDRQMILLTLLLPGLKKASLLNLESLILVNLGSFMIPYRLATLKWFMI